MKCAKEVMEQWEISMNERCKKDLCEMVERITEELFTQAKNGRNRIPSVGVYTHSTIEGKPEAIEMKMDSDKNYHYIVVWEDFVSVLNSLCYHVDKGTHWHQITPNPSC